MEKIKTLSWWIKILKNGKKVYNLVELSRISGLSIESTRKNTFRLVNKGLLIKLPKEKFVNSFKSVSLEEIVSIIYPPCYISMESALFHHGILDQAPFTITAITLNKTKKFSLSIGTIEYHHIKESLFFGFENSSGYPLATSEKALLDYIYIHLYHGDSISLDELNLENLNFNVLEKIAVQYPKSAQKKLSSLKISKHR